MRWTVPLVLVVVASCASTDEGAGRIGDVGRPGTSGETAVGGERLAPPGTRLEEVAELDIAFAVPEDWVTVDADDLGDVADLSASTDEFAELADRVGIDADVLRGLVDDQIALAVVAPDAGDGFASNLNVVELPARRLPSRSILEAGLAAAGAEVLDSAVVERDGGSTIDVRYHLEIGAMLIEGTVVFTEMGGVPFSVTVTSDDRAEADDVGELVAETLAPLG